MSSKHKSVHKANKKVIRDAAFKPVSRYWENVDWHLIVTCNYPDLKLEFEDKEDDWALYMLIDMLAEETDIYFVDAASWVLCRVLGRRLKDVQKMAKDEIPWVHEFQYICRVVALNLCKFFDQDAVPSLRQVDRMIWCLLITEDQLLAESATANRVPC